MSALSLWVFPIQRKSIILYFEQAKTPAMYAWKEELITLSLVSSAKYGSCIFWTFYPMEKWTWIINGCYNSDPLNILILGLSASQTKASSGDGYFSSSYCHYPQVPPPVPWMCSGFKVYGAKLWCSPRLCKEKRTCWCSVSFWTE